jgi:hypothetical protein
MSTTRGASQRIIDEVTSWPGVETEPGDHGELAFKVDGHEIGHLHGDRTAHFFFPHELWADLRRAGRIQPHPVFRASQGPAARPIRDESDVSDVIQLLRLNYELLAARHHLPLAR